MAPLRPWSGGFRMNAYDACCLPPQIPAPTNWWCTNSIVRMRCFHTNLYNHFIDFIRFVQGKVVGVEIKILQQLFFMVLFGVTDVEAQQQQNVEQL